MFLEKTRSNHKYVIPKLRPLNAIQMIAEAARPANHNAPGMVFYEDANGFHLRSYENMLAINSQKARPAVANFIVKVAGAQTPKQSIVEKMQQVNSFAIKKQFLCITARHILQWYACFVLYFLILHYCFISVKIYFI